MSTTNAPTTLMHINGLYVGQLTDDELAEFERLIAAGRAVRSYSGASGLMGLAKVKLLDASIPTPEGR